MSAVAVGSLEVASLGGRRYRVVDLAGSGTPRLINLAAEPPTCACPDHQFRGLVCKHLKAAEHYRRPVDPELRAVAEEVRQLHEDLVEIRLRASVLRFWLQLYMLECNPLTPRGATA